MLFYGCVLLALVPRRNLVRNATVQQITNVAWKKDGELIDLQTEERISMGVEVSGDLVTSILIVNNAGGSDAGSYSCTLPVFGNMDFPRARANVHLIYGDRLAVQGGASYIRPENLKISSFLFIPAMLHVLFPAWLILNAAENRKLTNPQEMLQCHCLFLFKSLQNLKLKRLTFIYY